MRVFLVTQNSQSCHVVRKVFKSHDKAWEYMKILATELSEKFNQPAIIEHYAINPYIKIGETTLYYTDFEVEE